MREKNAKKHGAQHQGRFKKYSIIGVFMLAAAGATYEAVDYTVDYLQEQHRIKVQTHSDEYVRLIKMGDSLNVELYATTMQFNGLKMNEIQAVRDRALLEAAAHGDERGVELALRYGANIHARNADEKGAGQLLLEANGLKGFKFVKRIYNGLHANLSFLYSNDALQYGLLQGADFDAQTEAVIDLLDILASQNINLAHIGSTLRGDTDLTLAQMANAAKNHDIIQRLSDIWAGGDAAKQLIWSAAHYESYLKSKKAPLIKVETGAYRRTDFRDYGEIQYDGVLVNDNDLDPTLFVIERLKESQEEDRKSGHFRHVYNTSYVAHGVMRRVDPDYDHKMTNLISARMRISESDEYDFTPVLEYSYHHPVVVSESVVSVPAKGYDYTKYYQTISWAYPQYLRALDIDTEYVHYNSAGNARDHQCITVDSVDFCVQDGNISRQSENIVRVGAVTKRGDGYKVHDFSAERPTFCAVMPKRGGDQLSGTSFSAPAAAAVERRLLDIFGRSAALPDGVVHDDVLMALMLTAQKNDLYDERSGKDVTPKLMPGGLMMDDRCGAGVIHPQAAANLLADMVFFARYDQKTQPTEMAQHSLMVVPSIGMGESGEYKYFVEVPEDGVLTTLRAGLYFPIDHRGAVKVQFGDEVPLVLDMSASGLSTDFRFAGRAVKAHDIITITTTRSLIDRGDPKHSGLYPFIDLKIAPPNSALAKAVEIYRAP